MPVITTRLAGSATLRSRPSNQRYRPHDKLVSATLKRLLAETDGVVVARRRKLAVELR
jgi:hypothetical protein